MSPASDRDEGEGSDQSDSDEIGIVGSTTPDVLVEDTGDVPKVSAVLVGVHDPGESTSFVGDGCVALGSTHVPEGSEG